MLRLGRTRTMAHAVALLLVAQGSACDDSKSKKGRDDVSSHPDANVNPDTSEDASVPGETDAETPKRATERRSAWVVEYASVAAVDLSGLDLPESLLTSQVSAKKNTNAIEDLRVIDGQLRFVTLSDAGTDHELELVIALDDKDIVVPVLIRSARPTEIVSFIDPAEGEATDSFEIPKLRVKGLGPSNALLGGELTFSVENAPVFDDKASSATLFVHGQNLPRDLAIAWTHDKEKNTLTIPEATMAEFLTLLPATELDFDIALTSIDGEFAYAWTFSSFVPRTELRVSVVDFEGQANLALQGKKIAVRGLDNRVRRIATVGEDGTFSLSGMLEGTYQITLLDVEQPSFWNITVPVFPDSTLVEADFVYQAFSKAKARGRTAPSSIKKSQQSTRQDGRKPPSRSQLRTKASSPESCGVTQEDGSATYLATAGTENQTVSCLAIHTLTKGTEKVSLKLTVTTAEHPTYTQQKSRYNDAWAYAVGLPGVSGSSGAVNDTHYTQGTTTRELCVDVSALTKNSDHTFQANLSTTNIGDSILPTAVELSVSTTCAPKLTVTQATFTTPNTKGYQIIRPIGNGNLVHNFVSIPLGAAQNEWGIPLTVQYEPKDAKITSAKLGVMVNGAPVLAGEDIFSQVTTKAPGKLTFKNLVVPRFPGAPFAGKTQVLVELTGEIEGDEVTSEASEGAVQFGSQKIFVPLFLAGEPLPDRRYGARDAGGDSWVTYNTLQWLSGRAYRFDDVTGLHAPQTASGQSALQHSGHSDGTQIDMRYSDGQGGFTEQLGGANTGAAILAMLNAAAAEVQTGGAGPKPNLDRAKAWITANRSMVELEAPGARKVYVGPSWMKLALFDGKFPSQTVIPDVGSWTSKPANVSFVQPHLHHWHASLLDI